MVMANDINQSIIEYLLQCPILANSPLFFNFANAEDENKQLVTMGNDRTLSKPYIDGSVLKQYTFTIIDYRSVIYQALVKQPGYSNENIEDMLDVQGIIDWIDEQGDIRNFPNFGDGYIIDGVKALTNNPNINGVDTSVQPALAKYSISIQIDYLDITKKLWN